MTPPSNKTTPTGLSPSSTPTNNTPEQASKEASRRHDHRQSIWIIAGGNLLWCYRCGAWRENSTGKGHKWYRPSGLNGDNPAMKATFK